MFWTKWNQSKYVALTVLFAAAIAIPRLNAQTTATIEGTVTDTSGAVISDAAIQVRNVGTDLTQSAKSDAQGRFTVVNLAIGEYEVQASKAGFATALRKGITLTVGSQNTIDFSLPVGQASQTITVDAEVSPVETNSSSLSNLVDETQMRELPLNGRNFEQLVLLAPGTYQVNTISASSFFGRASSYSVAGARPEGQAILLDGQNVQDFWNRGGGSAVTGNSLGVDAIGEFQTLTDTYTAQYGGNGAVVNAVTKSGSNAFHGSVYEFFRNSALDARNFFDGASVPAFRKNQFGATLGGPLKKDKMFFFVNYEGVRQALGQTKALFVPDDNAHQGILGSSTTPIAMSAAVQAVLALYPMTGIARSTNDVVRTTSVTTQNAKENYLLGRWDYIASDKDSIFVRYIMDRANVVDPSGGSPIPLWPEHDTQANYFATIEEKRIVASNIVNFARLSFGRPNQAADTTNSVPALQYFPGESRPDAIIAVSGLTTIGSNTLLPFYLIQNKIDAGDEVFWTHGSHNIKFGVQIERAQSNTRMDFRAGSSWTFTSLSNFLNGTASLVSGPLPGAQNADSVRDFRSVEALPYIQDDWKVTSKLTLNLGLRYGFITNPVERRDKLQAMLNVLTANNVTAVPHVFQSNPSLMNFDPRVGLAYDLFGDHKTSLRAAFGVFHDVLEAKSYVGSYWLNPPYRTAQQQFPTFPTPFSSVAASPLTITNGTNYYNRATPYMIQYNVNIQREITPGTVLTIGYVGSHGVHLIMNPDQNPPTPTTINGVESFGSLVNGRIVSNTRLNPALGQMTLRTMSGNSRYNSLQASVNRRLNRNVQAQISYTWSRCIDDNSAFTPLESTGSAVIQMDPFNANFDRGRCTFDIPQNFKANSVILLPFHKNRLVEGWQVTGIVTASAGPPVSVNDGFDQAGIVDTNPRPNYVSGCRAVTGDKTHWFNPACFAIEPVGTLGNLGRNSLSAPGLVNADVALMKNTKISEKLNVQFRAEVFNVFNHTNLALPSLTAFTQGTNGGANANSTFGTFSSTTTNSRQLQLGLKVIF